MNIRRILVPVDYSAHSRIALQYAAALAERLGAALEVVHVWDRPSYVPEGLTVGPPGQSKSLADLIRDNADQEMGTFLAASSLPAGVQIERQLIGGEPAKAIIHHVETTRPDLVVLGSHGRTGVQHLLLGSVAEKIVRASVAPVLTVPPTRQ